MGGYTLLPSGMPWNLSLYPSSSRNPQEVLETAKYSGNIGMGASPMKASLANSLCSFGADMHLLWMMGIAARGLCQFSG